jgi:hypothetical protein
MTKPNKQSLAQIARKLTALEKNDVKSAIEKGRLLQEARDQCEEGPDTFKEGTYIAWLESIGWSYRSAKRYRNIYALAQTNRQIAGLFVSVSTLHLLADPLTPEKARKAIIKAALKGRVDHSEAQAIIDKLDAPPPPRDPPDVEPDDDDEDEDDDDEVPDEIPDDEPPPDDADEPDSSEPNELAKALEVVWHHSGQCGEWRKAVKTIGRVKLQGIANIVSEAYSTHFGTDSMKAAADRAQARAAMTARPAKEREDVNG